MPAFSSCVIRDVAPLKWETVGIFREPTAFQKSRGQQIFQKEEVVTKQTNKQTKKEIPKEPRHLQPIQTYTFLDSYRL